MLFFYFNNRENCLYFDATYDFSVWLRTGNMENLEGIENKLNVVIPELAPMQGLGIAKTGN